MNFFWIAFICWEEKSKFPFIIQIDQFYQMPNCLVRLSDFQSYESFVKYLTVFEKEIFGIFMESLKKFI